MYSCTSEITFLLPKTVARNSGFKLSSAPSGAFPSSISFIVWIVLFLSLGWYLLICRSINFPSPLISFVYPADLPTSSSACLLEIASCADLGSRLFFIHSEPNALPTLVDAAFPRLLTTAPSPVATTPPPRTEAGPSIKPCISASTGST